MPQVDLESLFRLSGDLKVVCETQILPQPLPEKQDPPETPLYFPAESFCLSRLEENDWVQRNAVFERNESTRGNSMSNSNPSSTANSQRFSMNLKPTGLPKLQLFGYLGFDFRRGFRSSSLRFIRPRIGKPVPPGDEPASPKISCMGKLKRKDSTCGGKDHRRTTEKSQRKIRFWLRFLAALRFGRGKTQTVGCDEDSTRSNIRADACNSSAEQSAPETKPPPCLGDMKRFSSCRRSSSWGGGGVDVDVSHHVDVPDTSDCDKVLGRRSVRPPLLDCARSWTYAGPATI